MRRWLGLALVLALVAVANVGQAQDPSGPPAGPSGIHVAYGQDPSAGLVATLGAALAAARRRR